MPSGISRRVDALERSQHPPGQHEVDGVMMGMPEMIAHFRRLAIDEQRRDPAAAARRRGQAIQRAEARRGIAADNIPLPASSPLGPLSAKTY